MLTNVGTIAYVVLWNGVKTPIRGMVIHYCNHAIYGKFYRYLYCLREGFIDLRISPSLGGPMNSAVN